MPSNRRIKAFFLLLGVALLLTIYITASGRQTRGSDFYTKTSDALAASRAKKESKLHDVESAVGEDSAVSKRLKAAEAAAKKEADRKGDAFHSEETKQKAMNFQEKWAQEGTGKKKGTRPRQGEKGVAGRKIYKDEKQATLKEDEDEDEDDAETEDKPISRTRKGSAKDEDEAETEEKPISRTRKGTTKDAEPAPKKSRKETDDEEKAHTELNNILKKSPIIIFSKTYCPYSKRAKNILLEKYKITPAPYVVELDTHPLGPALQAYLGKLTGRKTVPNILIEGRSLGGGDDVAALDESGKLEETVRGMGRKGMEITKVVAEGQEKAKIRK